MYSTMPGTFSEVLQTYIYKGVRPHVVDTPDITRPFAAVMIADTKLPATGNPKILEFGGIHSRLKGYPDGELVAIDRLQRLIASMGKPVTVLDGRSKLAKLLDPATDNGGLVGGYFASGEAHGFEYGNDASLYLGDGVPCDDIRDYERLVWCVRFDPPPALDARRCLFANPPRFSTILREKTDVNAVFEQGGLQRFRPRSWPVSAEQPLATIRAALAECASEWFVLKPTILSRGRGVTVIHRDDLLKRVEAICVAAPPKVLHNDWPRREPPTDEPIENWLRFYSLLLEELVSSKPVMGDDGRLYDGVLRQCFMVVSNRGQTVFVPFCSYWKLSSQSLSGGVSNESIVSDIKGGEGTAPVEPADLARAFEAIPHVLPAFIRADHNPPT